MRLGHGCCWFGRPDLSCWCWCGRLGRGCWCWHLNVCCWCGSGRRCWVHRWRRCDSAAGHAEGRQRSSQRVGVRRCAAQACAPAPSQPWPHLAPARHCPASPAQTRACWRRVCCAGRGASPCSRLQQCTERRTPACLMLSVTQRQGHTRSVGTHTCRHCCAAASSCCAACRRA